mmetsp:Transcript_17548/g.41206  ORF Transcript_17548/g.41206 Transcript_17548/m.41206 type:complete len:276 (-) Transcript_17548:142-969(-)
MLRVKLVCRPGLVPSARVGNHEAALPTSWDFVVHSGHAESLLLPEQALLLWPAVRVPRPVWKHAAEVLHVEDPRWTCGKLGHNLVKVQFRRFFTCMSEPGHEVCAQIVLLRQHPAGADQVQVRVGGERLDEQEVRVQDGHHGLLWLCSLQPLRDRVGPAPRGVDVLLPARHRHQLPLREECREAFVLGQRRGAQRLAYLVCLAACDNPAEPAHVAHLCPAVVQHHGLHELVVVTPQRVREVQAAVTLGLGNVGPGDTVRGAIGPLNQGHAKLRHT